MELELREVTPEVLDELRAQVVLPPHQAEWVGGSVDDSLQEAAELPEGTPWPRGVYRDGVPVGFVMLSWNVDPHPPSLYGPWFLWKLMVAPAAQGTPVGIEDVEARRPEVGDPEPALVVEGGAARLAESRVGRLVRLRGLADERPGAGEVRLLDGRHERLLADHVRAALERLHAELGV